MTPETCATCRQRLPSIRDATPLVPDIQNLLRTNHAIMNHSELNSLKEAIVKEGSNISELDRELAAYKTLMETLTIERNMRLQRVAAYESILAPIRRMPSEILLHIMRETLDAVEDSEDLDLSLGEQLMTLIHVSCSWRTTVLSAPNLWQCIFITPQTSPDFCAWLLERSSNLPLLVNIQCGGQKNKPMMFGPAIDNLISHSNRWQDIAFDGLPVDAPVKLRSVQDHLPILKRLNLGSHWEGQQISPPVLRIFKNAPSLTNALFSIPFCPSNLVLPWEQLTTFACSGLQLSHLHQILSLCHNLEDFQARECCKSGLDDVEYGEITLRHLCFVEMFWIEPRLRNISPFFSSLALPSIEKMILTIPTVFLTNTQDIIELMDSLPSLDCFVLCLAPGNPSQCNELLENWLTVLSLTYDDGTPTHARNIKRIRISAEVYYLEADEATLLASVLEVRWKLRESDPIDPYPKFTYAFTYDPSDAGPVIILMDSQEKGNFQLFSAVDSDGDHRTIVQSINPGHPLDIWPNPDDILNNWDEN